MKILAVNVGSSSLKFVIYKMPQEIKLMTGSFTKIGEDISFCKIDGEEIEVKLSSHEEAVQHLMNVLIDKGNDDIDFVGHRIVHGGDIYSDSVIIDDKVINDVESLADLSPLHNPANLIGIRAFKKFLPNIKMVGVFDTAFHQTIQKELYIYPVPYEWYEKYGVRKYGFHGTSYKYITGRIEKIRDNDKFKAIVCHLGNGGSIAAIRDMKCVDTTMGFTPLSGIPMGTRSGDIDPTIIPFIKKKTGMSVDDVLNKLNNDSGLLGLSGVSNDLREVEKAIKQGDVRSRLALDVFTTRVVANISKFNTLLENADILVFTGGIGERSVFARREICRMLKPLGIEIDQELNEVMSKEKKISSDDSSMDVYVIPTNEELMIARDTYNLAK